MFNGTTRLIEQDMDLPLRTRRPSVFFAPSEGDLFGEGVTDGMRDRVLSRIAACPEHLFLTLTKRPSCARAYLTATYDSIGPEWRVCRTLRNRQGMAGRPMPWTPITQATPLSNLWLGTSVEDQATAEKRIPDLLATPAALRFISCEPLLGPVNLRTSLYATPWPLGGHELPGIDWVIVGGESGIGARPMHPEWVRGLRNQCAGAGVPFFMKQWGHWAEREPGIRGDGARIPDSIAIDPKGYQHPVSDWAKPGIKVLYAFGKKAAGHLLDGRAHLEVPQ